MKSSSHCMQCKKPTMVMLYRDFDADAVTAAEEKNKQENNDRIVIPGICFEIPISCDCLKEKSGKKEI